MADVGTPRDTAKFDGRPDLCRGQAAPRSPGEQRPPRIVAFGGGTGVPVVLKGLKAGLFPPGWPWIAQRDRDRLTAIITAADDGGSSGRLRQAYHVPPPGDLRNCLVALADGNSTLATIFNFRFGGDGEVGGHSLGNLILTALGQLEPDLAAAVERGGEMLAIRGRVLPATLANVTLRAEFDDGSQVEGESRIPAVHRPIRRVVLQPDDARALPEAREAVEAADLIVIGPGSLYTSLIPTLLIKELAQDLGRSRARIVLVMNLMTEPGETDGYTATDHLLAIRRHAPQLAIDDVLINTAPIPAKVVEYYADQGATPVLPDVEPLRAMGYRPIERDLLGVGTQIRHDPDKLARAVLDLAEEREPWR